MPVNSFTIQRGNVLANFRIQNPFKSLFVYDNEGHFLKRYEELVDLALYKCLLLLLLLLYKD